MRILGIFLLLFGLGGTFVGIERWDERISIPGVLRQNAGPLVVPVAAVVLAIGVVLIIRSRK